MVATQFDDSFQRKPLERSESMISFGDRQEILATSFDSAPKGRPMLAQGDLALGIGINELLKP
jgi:hypothetical protein